MKYLYKKVDDLIVSQLFEESENPKGWVDDPAKCKDVKKPTKKAK